MGGQGELLAFSQFGPKGIDWSGPPSTMLLGMGEKSQPRFRCARGQGDERITFGFAGFGVRD
jgi:hypothetical protein